jgi:hypothetical protein
MLNHLSKFAFASISFQVVVPFCVNTAIPAGFPLSEALEVILWQHLHHVLRFSLVDLFNALKTSPLELELRFRKYKKSEGAGE